jgi:hypothetical protein
MPHVCHICCIPLDITRRTQCRVALTCSQNEDSTSVRLRALRLFLLFGELIAVQNSQSLQRGYGWGPKGMSLYRRGRTWRGLRKSWLGTLSLGDGILSIHMTEATYTTDLVKQAFTETVLPNLQAYPGPNSILILDGARSHPREWIYEQCAVRTHCAFVCSSPRTPTSSVCNGAILFLLF